MFKINVLKIIVICVCVASVDAYIFSFEYATDLIALRRKLQNKFEDLTNTYEHELGYLKKYTDELKQVLEIAGNYKQIEEFVSNPIYSFKLVKLLTSDFHTLKKNVKGKEFHEFLERVTKSTKTYNLIFPSVYDLNGICQAIVRLQDIYDIAEDKILSGKFQNYWEGTLSENDLRDLRFCYQYNKKFNTNDWMYSEIQYDDKSEETLLLEYYKALKSFAELIRLTSGDTMRRISLDRLNK